MSNELNPPPQRKYLRSWIILSLSLIIPLAYFVVRSSQQPETASATQHPIGHMILMTIVGLFFLALGVACYLVVIFTHAFTFNFKKPVWNAIKPKMFLANIFVPIIAMIGMGLLFSAFLTPVFESFNLPGRTAFMLPFMLAILVSQATLMFVLVWSPLEKEVIKRRLLALGVTKEQLKNGLYIGVSNPNTKSNSKRLWCIEEDVGMLWFTPDHLIYWGDGEQFGISRDQLLQMERKTDAKSTTALSGTAHVILHVVLPDGNQRQIRLHTEGVWTMIGKRKASDHLAAQITTWRSEGAVVAS